MNQRPLEVTVIAVTGIICAKRLLSIVGDAVYLDSRPVNANDNAMADYPEHIVSRPSEIRTDYARGELLEADASENPFEQFAQWFADAEEAKLMDVNAMTLATADATGKPSARVVLLKGFDERGFTFFTNYQSRKGRELAVNPRASLVIFWAVLERQVRIDGSVQKTSREESDQYFHSRPVKSQIAACVSQQSDVVQSRDELVQLQTQLTSAFEGKEVPLPDYWGGYRLAPEEIEFWQGRRSRLHDRLRYSRGGDVWKRERLSP